MKNEKRKLASLLKLFIILAVPFLFTSSEAGERLKIEIRSDKTEYLTREPISVHYRIKNIGDQPAIMIFHAIKGYFNIQDQQGRQYPNLLSGSYGFISDSLKPNEAFEGSEGIDGRYGIVDAGEYTCYLESPQWINAPSARSNEIKITIRNPEGEEKKALGLHLEAEGLRYGRDDQGKTDHQKRELGFQRFQVLVDKYPKSTYAPLALKAAIGTYLYSQNLAERRRIIPICIKLIEDYPAFCDFVGTFTDLAHTYEILKDKEGAIKTMQELIKKHPESKISERAEYWLERIEKWEFE